MAGQQLYHDVLIPTDGSAAAEAAVDHAIAVADAEGATVHALFVIDVRITMAADDGTRDDLSESLRQEGEKAVEAVATRAAETGLDAKTSVSRGTPWKEVLEYADREAVDLIAIGTTGKSPREKRMGLGSVSERVVDDATVPVLVVPGGS